MGFSMRIMVLIATLCAFPGCVTSHYKDAKGNDCTRRYFTMLGIPTHNCTEGAPAAAVSPSVVPAAASVQDPVAPATTITAAEPEPAGGIAVAESMDFLANQTVAEAAKK